MRYRIVLVCLGVLALVLLAGCTFNFGDPSGASRERSTITYYDDQNRPVTAMATLQPDGTYRLEDGTIVADNRVTAIVRGDAVSCVCECNVCGENACPVSTPRGPVNTYACAPQEEWCNPNVSRGDGVCCEGLSCIDFKCSMPRPRACDANGVACDASYNYYCCSGYCDASGVCGEKIPQCHEYGAYCTANADCCSGRCDTNYRTCLSEGAPTSCSGTSMSCQDQPCCSGLTCNADYVCEYQSPNTRACLPQDNNCVPSATTNPCCEGLVCKTFGVDLGTVNQTPPDYIYTCQNDDGSSCLLLDNVCYPDRFDNGDCCVGMLCLELGLGAAGDSNATEIVYTCRLPSDTCLGSRQSCSADAAPGSPGDCCMGYSCVNGQCTPRQTASSCRYEYCDSGEFHSSCYYSTEMGKCVCGVNTPCASGRCDAASAYCAPPADQPACDYEYCANGVFYSSCLRNNAGVCECSTNSACASGQCDATGSYCAPAPAAPACAANGAICTTSPNPPAELTCCSGYSCQNGVCGTPCAAINGACQSGSDCCSTYCDYAANRCVASANSCAYEYCQDAVFHSSCMYDTGRQTCACYTNVNCTSGRCNEGGTGCA